MGDASKYVPKSARRSDNLITGRYIVECRGINREEVAREAIEGFPSKHC